MDVDNDYILKLKIESQIEKVKRVVMHRRRRRISDSGKLYVNMYMIMRFCICF